MLWEECAEPQAAAQAFDRSIRHQNRVATQFPPRLKGNWDPNGTGTVPNYFRYLVWLRNRVVRTGALPHQDEVSLAFDTLVELETFLRRSSMR